MNEQGSTLFQAQDPHGVQSIDEREAQTEPLCVGLGDGLQLVVAPGKLLVAPPSVPERLPHALEPKCFWKAQHKAGVG